MEGVFFKFLLVLDFLVTPKSSHKCKKIIFILGHLLPNSRVLLFLAAAAEWDGLACSWFREVTVKAGYLAASVVILLLGLVDRCWVGWASC